MIRLTKISCAGPNYESIRILSYSFISTLDPLGQSINKYTALLGKLNRSVLAFMRGSRGDVGGPDLLENHVQCWGLNMKSCFLTVGPGPPPLAKIPGSVHGFALGTYYHGSI